MAGTRTEYQIAIDSLKSTLKRQRVTYKELAQRLELSESGLKKILSAKDGSFQRLAQICKELGLSMQELLQGNAEQTHEVFYSDDQQEFLLAHPRALSLYWALVLERRTLPDAQKFVGLTEKETFSILRKLDQLELLELLPNTRVRVPPVRPVRWVGGGPLVSKLYRDWSMKFLTSVATPEQKPDQLFIIRYYRASRRTIDDLMTALRDLENEFVRRATRDMRSEAPDLEHLRWMMTVDKKSFLE